MQWLSQDMENMFVTQFHMIYFREYSGMSLYAFNWNFTVLLNMSFCRFYDHKESLKNLLYFIFLWQWYKGSVNYHWKHTPKDLLFMCKGASSRNLGEVWGQVEKKKNMDGMCVCLSAYPVFIYVTLYLCEEYQITRYKPYNAWFNCHLK